MNPIAKALRWLRSHSLLSVTVEVRPVAKLRHEDDPSLPRWQRDMWREARIPSSHN
jgi:hypothetical protein